MPSSAKTLALRLLLVVCLLATQGLVAVQPAAAAPAPIDPSLVARMNADPSAQQPIILEMDTAGAAVGVTTQLAQQALNLISQRGLARAKLPLIGSAAGLVDAAGITALSNAPGVAYVHFDAEVNAHVDGRRLRETYPKVVNADRVWAMGRTGRGVTVAVLDTGIINDPDLTQPTNRILARVNFANQLGSLTDPGGHGSHVAGTIAGNGTRSGGQYIGIAPEANLVDVRVLDENGQGRYSSVIMGIQWAFDYRAQYNIRVINLSLGAVPPVNNYRLDPLSAAVEMAWRQGIVVVAAAGNEAGALHSPGANPYVITVGATDDRDTTTIGDDLWATFSGSGTPMGGSQKPELVLPGRRIVSLRVPGSQLDQLYTDRIETASSGATYFRLSGTSMATAVASGMVALLLEHQPTLKPDAVKAILTGTSRPFGHSSGSTPPAYAIGSGLGDAYAAVISASYGLANRGVKPSHGQARSIYPALYNRAPLSWLNPQLGGILWNLLTWLTLTWNTLAWDNLNWDNIAYDTIAWSNIAYDNIAYDNVAWNNIAYDNIAYDNIAYD